MQPNERRKWILEQLSRDEKIDIDEMAAQLNVSAMTIRRDLAYLEEEDKIIRTLGGAILNKPLINETPFLTKEGKYSRQKKAIAQKAMTLVQDHSTILLDSGTTTLEIARLLKEKNNLTVVTNDIKIAAELMDSEVKVIVAGGELQNSVGALFGPMTELLLQTIHVDLFFLGAHAIHLEAGVTAPTFEKASIKQRMLEAAESTWLVADSSKFDQKSFTKVCDLSLLDGWITDDELSDEDEAKAREHLKVVTAKGG
ncbi:DeoR/GlpR family DNA-binding transcription regulator [Brevibacillus sp. TJ4]|uniref:DeoR/GlpR family DNA-binding transcription regulator n=1 Tax=Brevibacillus sp. TJ4 TaxID=3234853 RepID=UPI0037D05D97